MNNKYLHLFVSYDIFYHMKKDENKFPRNETVRKIRAKLEKKKASYMLAPDACAADKAKYDICRHIILYIHQKGITQRKLANILNVPETRVSEIVNYNIWKFTIDRLLAYYEILNPKTLLKLA